MSTCLSLVFFFLATSAGAQGPGRPPAPSAESEQALDLPTYLATLDHWSAAVAELAEHPADLTTIKQTLPQRWLVRVAEQQFEVSTKWLGAALDKLEKNPKQRDAIVRDIRARLAVLREEGQTLAESSSLELAVAQAKLQDILSRREFAAIREPTWFDRLRATIRAWMIDLLSRLFRNLGRYPQTGEIMVWAVIALGLALCAVAALRYLSRAGPPAQPPPQAVRLRGRSMQEWLTSARAAAERGDYREAVHCAYWLAVMQLEKLGVWAADATRTPREHLGSLSRNSEYLPAISLVTQRFELTWYGCRPATVEDFRQVTAQLERMGCRFLPIPAIAES